jgi:hypothetical protein
MKNKTFTLIALLSLLLISVSGVAENQKEANSNLSLLFKTGNYQVQENIDEFVSNFRSIASGEEIHYRIIQFNEIPNNLNRTLLAENGIVLHDYIPNMAYLATIASDANIVLLNEMNARAISEIIPEYKLDFDLYTQDYPEHALRPDNRIELFIHYFKSVDNTSLISQLALQDIHIIEQGFIPGYMLISSPIGKIDWIVSLPEIHFIEAVHPPSEPENDTGRTLHRSSNIANDHFFGRKYDGSGVNVMLQDDGIIGPHIDYQGRIGTQNISYNSGDHGDHIAGTIMGAGNLDPKARGMAPGSTIHVYGASGYQGFGLISSHYESLDIRLTSTSYSNGCNAGYTSLARTMDQQVRLFPSLMHVFSAGNSGTSNCGYGAGSGWGNITGGHKIGKNVIAVGNVDLTDGLAGSSSRGPAHDGRIKPEIVAKGSSVYSTTNPNLYTLKSGTSMACPGISGTLAQLYHAYGDLNDGEEPTGGLMKMILMNTADDLGNAGPDFRFGYGRVNALRAVKTLEEYRYDSAVVEQGETTTHLLDVPEDTHELRIMVYWTDYEANVGVTKALVNNLNMLVTDPDDEEFLPWILDHTPNPVNLNMLATRGVDSINNVEQVTILNPAAGQYEINVSGHLVPQGPQSYYITWEFVTDHVLLTYPFGGEAFIPAESEMLRWDATESTENFTLEYSLDDGVNWELISENVSANVRYFTWTVPVAITNTALVRISRGDLSSVSENTFTIMGVPENLNIAWSCQTSFRMTWDPVPGASYYIVRKLGERYMDFAGATPLTSFIFTDVSPVITWVTVQAVGDNGQIGQRAYAIMKQAGSFNCLDVDLAAEAITSAEWKVYHNSHDLTEFPVEIKIRNIASTAVSDFAVGYTLDGGEPLIQLSESTLMPDSSLVLQLEGLLDLSEPGEYLLKAWVHHDSDGNIANDTITQLVRVIEDDVIQPYPWYIQTFEDFDRCLAHPTCELYVCDLAEGWINLINESEDQIDWRAFGGSTPTGGTGPSFDKTTETALGNYVYLEPSVFCTNREAILLTPTFNLEGAEGGSLSFWYHMWGNTVGSLHVDAFSGHTVYHDLIAPIRGSHGNEWKQVTIPLDAFVGELVNFRFRGITGPDHFSDIALDDIEISMTVGVPSLQAKEMNVNIYPNPNTGIFTLDINDPNPGRLNVKITDLMGKIVYEREFSNTGSPMKQQIDLSQLSSGVYFLVAGNSAGQTQRKLIKQ